MRRFADGDVRCLGWGWGHGRCGGSGACPVLGAALQERRLSYGPSASEACA